MVGLENPETARQIPPLAVMRQKGRPQRRSFVLICFFLSYFASRTVRLSEHEAVTERDSERPRHHSNQGPRAKGDCKRRNTMGRLTH